MLVTGQVDHPADRPVRSAARRPPDIAYPPPTSAPPTAGPGPRSHGGRRPPPRPTGCAGPPPGAGPARTPSCRHGRGRHTRPPDRSGAQRGPRPDQRMNLGEHPHSGRPVPGTATSACATRSGSESRSTGRPRRCAPADRALRRSPRRRGSQRRRHRSAPSERAAYHRDPRRGLQSSGSLVATDRRGPRVPVRRDDIAVRAVPVRASDHDPILVGLQLKDDDRAPRERLREVIRRLIEWLRDRR